MKIKRQRGPTITEVRRAHEHYVEMSIRYGENNMATQSAMQTYYKLKGEWQAANPDKTYRP